MTKMKFELEWAVCLRLAHLSSLTKMTDWVGRVIESDNRPTQPPTKKEVLQTLQEFEL